MEPENEVSDEWESEYGESIDENNIQEEQVVDLEINNTPAEVTADQNELFKFSETKPRKSSNRLDRECVENKLIELGLIANNPLLVKEIGNLLREKNVKKNRLLSFLS